LCAATRASTRICVERDGNDYHIKSIKSAIVDGKKIKANTWYTVRGVKFVVVE